MRRVRPDRGDLLGFFILCKCAAAELLSPLATYIAFFNPRDAPAEYARMESGLHDLMAFVNIENAPLILQGFILKFLPILLHLVRVR